MTAVTPRPHSLAGIIESLPSDLGVTVIGDTSKVVTGISSDHRLVQTGDLFCCVRGESFDGHQFAHDAISHGAVALLVEQLIEGLGQEVVQVQVSRVRDAIGWFAAAIYDHPARDLVVVGVTGTNGKTSTTSMIGDLLRGLGHSVMVFGTLSGERTTPEAIDMQQRLAQCRADGVSHVVMEVSSHALVQGRVFGTRFDVVAFTNLGQDHLDYHKTQEAYFAAKASLFRGVYADRAVVNIDDPHGLMIFDTTDVPVNSFGLNDITDVVVSARSSQFQWHDNMFRVPIGGAFTVMNLLAAVTVVKILGYSPSDIARACQNVQPIRGRFELVAGTNDFDVVVDYAHTPEGLEELLKTARTLTQGRLIVVFGCGGDRDRAKRPMMGQLAAGLADVVIVTSDNPRNEDPQVIIDEISAGITAPRAAVHHILDRRDAIHDAINRARGGDLVVIAGKGHEITQEIAGVKTEFDDVQVAKSALLSVNGATQ
jgi:UDP-N-acetylmuramoyl-L-alanyl-D-glutamate--2,6-diaminopimelate ligase